MGTTRKEDRRGTPIMENASGLIKWSSDIRGAISFNTLADITTRRDAIKKIVTDWLSIPPTARP